MSTGGAAHDDMRAIRRDQANSTPGAPTVGVDTSTQLGGACIDEQLRSQHQTEQLEHPTVCTGEGVALLDDYFSAGDTEVVFCRTCFHGVQPLVDGTCRGCGKAYRILCGCGRSFKGDEHGRLKLAKHRCPARRNSPPPAALKNNTRDREEKFPLPAPVKNTNTKDPEAQFVYEEDLFQLAQAPGEDVGGLHKKAKEVDDLAWTRVLPASEPTSGQAATGMATRDQGQEQQWGGWSYVTALCSGTQLLAVGASCYVSWVAVWIVGQLFSTFGTAASDVERSTVALALEAGGLLLLGLAIWALFAINVQPSGFGYAMAAVPAAAAALACAMFRFHVRSGLLFLVGPAVFPVALKCGKLLDRIEMTKARGQPQVQRARAANSKRTTLVDLSDAVSLCAKIQLFQVFYVCACRATHTLLRNVVSGTEDNTAAQLMFMSLELLGALALGTVIWRMFAWNERVNAFAKTVALVPATATALASAIFELHVRSGLLFLVPTAVVPPAVFCCRFLESKYAIL